jgi:hypothetical protein
MNNATRRGTMTKDKTNSNTSLVVDEKEGRTMKKKSKAKKLITMGDFEFLLTDGMELVESKMYLINCLIGSKHARLVHFKQLVAGLKGVVDQMEKRVSEVDTIIDEGE